MALLGVLQFYAAHAARHAAFRTSGHPDIQKLLNAEDAEGAQRSQRKQEKEKTFHRVSLCDLCASLAHSAFKGF
jgi:hypothetical protein